VLALEGLAARVGLVITRAVTGVPNKVGKAFFGGRDLL